VLPYVGKADDVQIHVTAAQPQSIAMMTIIEAGGQEGSGPVDPTTNLAGKRKVTISTMSPETSQGPSTGSSVSTRVDLSPNKGISAGQPVGVKQDTKGSLPLVVAPKHLSLVDEALRAAFPLGLQFIVEKGVASGLELVLTRILADPDLFVNDGGLEVKRPGPKEFNRCVAAQKAAVVDVDSLGVPGLLPGTTDNRAQIGSDGSLQVLHYSEAEEQPGEFIRHLNKVLEGRCRFEDFSKRWCRRLAHVYVQACMAKTREAGLSLALWCASLDLVCDTSDNWFKRFLFKSFFDFLTDRYEVRMKFLTALVQARKLDEWQVLPPRPSWISITDSHFLGGGTYKDFETLTARSRRAIASWQVHRLVILNSVTSLKKRQPPIPDIKLAKATRDWKKALFTERPLQPVPHRILKVSLTSGETREVSATTEPVVFQKGPSEALPKSLPTGPEWAIVKKKVDEILDMMIPNLRKRCVALPSLSTRARLDSKSSAGGMFGVLKRSLDPSLHLPPWLEPSTALPTQIFNLGRFEKLSGFDRTELFGLVPEATRLLYEQFSYRPDDLIVQGVALPEPFKVRMISKSVAVSYWTITGVQKLSHEALQAIAGFQLTREVVGRDISTLLNLSMPNPTLGGVGGRSVLPDEEEDSSDHLWAVSGDYTASTDNLNPDLSEYIVAGISGRANFSPHVAELFRASLTEHFLPTEREEIDAKSNFIPLDYTAVPAETIDIIEDLTAKFGEGGFCWDDVAAAMVDSKLIGLKSRRGTKHEDLSDYLKTEKQVGKRVKQASGQLMGSPTSFPVLCIANMALTCAALEMVEGPGSRPIGSSGVEVNGDDVGFVAKREAILSWQRLTTTFGLSPSVGKNFVSREFLQLNSKMFRIESFDSPQEYTIRYPIEDPTKWVTEMRTSLWVLVPCPSEQVFGGF